jgi:hypothetical protein
MMAVLRGEQARQVMARMQWRASHVEVEPVAEVPAGAPSDDAQRARA